MACKLDASLPHFNLILLGKVGVGKSATGNSILEKKAFRSKRSSTSTTRNIQMENVRIHGVSFSVYDTPGFCNTEISNEDVMQKCRSVLPLHGCDPTVFLLVIPFGRFTSEDRSAVQEAQKILGRRHSQNTWILFTNGDALERDGLSVEEFLENSTHLKQVVEKFDNRYHVFNNTTQNPGQVKELLDKIRGLIKRPPSWSMILLGKSGDGKSATGNTILGRPGFASEPGFRSVTQSTQKEKVTICGISINLFDTPGLYNTEISQEDVIREYRCLLQLADLVPTVFLLVLRADRPNKEDMSTVSEIEALLGEKLLQNTWILFTGGDELEREGGTIEEKNELKSVIQRFNNRYHVFNNNITNPDQVQKLVDKIEASSVNTGQLMEMTLSIKDKPPSWNMILLGKSGDGKSATGNTILGRPGFASEPGFRSVTQSTQKEKVTICGISINLFDTPGLYNTEISHEDVIREYRCLLQLADLVPTVFLLVLRADRPNKEDMSTVLEIEELLGDELLQDTWILFTGGDELEREGGTIEEKNELKSIVQRFNNRYHVFNNNITNPDQVTQLIMKC